ncbi:MAG: hypothetical protein IT516_10990 [Burkholderiales bacterium]|nr:hypothetical protein [Burkholderiales bacterium]
MRITSDRPLPELPVGGEYDLDVDVRFVAERDAATGARAGPPAAGTRPDDTYALPASTRQRGWIHANGREVVITEPPGGCADVAAALRGVVPFASALQGRVILHASAVACPEGIHAFVGASGVGKSTLAKHLGARGWPIVADDLTPCRIEGATVRVPLPAALGEAVACPGLRAIHFLSRSQRIARVQHDALAAPVAIRELLWHGFSDLDAPDLWAKHFVACADIARRVPSYALVVPDERGRVAEIADAVRDVLTASGLSPAAR